MSQETYSPQTGLLVFLLGAVIAGYGLQFTDATWPIVPGGIAMAAGGGILIENLALGARNLWQGFARRNAYA